MFHRKRGSCRVTFSVLPIVPACRACEVLFQLAGRVALRSSFEFVVEDTHGTAMVLWTAVDAGAVREVISAHRFAYAERRHWFRLSETRN
jgi:hypothetical protein